MLRLPYQNTCFWFCCLEVTESLYVYEVVSYNLARCKFWKFSIPQKLFKSHIAWGGANCSGTWIGSSPSWTNHRMGKDPLTDPSCFTHFPWVMLLFGHFVWVFCSHGNLIKLRPIELGKVFPFNWSANESGLLFVVRAIFFFLRRYNFREVLAFSKNSFHLGRFLMQSFQFVIFIFVISLFASSSQLFFGLPGDLVNAGAHSYTFFLPCCCLAYDVRV
jgi:hypothetical protein